MFPYKPSIWGYPHLWKPPWEFIRYYNPLHSRVSDIIGRSLMRFPAVASTAVEPTLCSEHSHRTEDPWCGIGKISGLMPCGRQVRLRCQLCRMVIQQDSKDVHTETSGTEIDFLMCGMISNHTQLFIWIYEPQHIYLYMYYMHTVFYIYYTYYICINLYVYIYTHIICVYIHKCMHYIDLSWI